MWHSRVQVTDFNLSRIVEDTQGGSSMAAMNPRWLAPEVMQGERATQASGAGGQDGAVNSRSAEGQCGRP